ncbi:MAG: chorismate mutase [Candidatus Delongbacteria bacterium]
MKKLSEIRSEIDLLDSKIASMLVKRLDLILSAVDKKDGVEDLRRESEIITRLTDGLSEPFKIYIKNIYLNIFTEGKNIMLKKRKGYNTDS